MSDYDPEQAFLLSMQNDSTYSPENNGYAPMDEDDDEDEYDPSSLNMGWQPSSANVTTKMEDRDDYDPTERTFKSPTASIAASASVTNSQAPSRTGSTIPNQTTAPPESLKSPLSTTTMPRIIGGFAADDSDEEDGVAPPPFQSRGFGGEGITGAAQSHEELTRSVTQTPVIASNNASSTLPQSHVSINEAEANALHADNTSTPISNALNGAVPSASNTPKPEFSNLSVPPVAAPAATASSAEQSGDASNAVTTSSSVLPKARLPTDVIGLLEDRILDDPRGDTDAWYALINEYKKRNRPDDVRESWNRFFTVFPTAAEQYAAFIQWELDNHEDGRADQLFGRSLLTIPNVQLWIIYIDVIRRRHNLFTDHTGDARRTITQAYEFTLSQVGSDKDSGKIWRDYMNFLNTAPGKVGGTEWQDQQKTDALRKEYQRAVAQPMGEVEAIWKEYVEFETQKVDKFKGRKFVQEVTAAYTQARYAYKELQVKTANLKRTTIPRLPPAPGFEGDDEYAQQVRIWNDWIAWEKSDPLIIKDDDLAQYHKRILYTYKQASHALRFWPELWCDAADFCFENDLEKDGDDFLTEGAKANPESLLIAFKRADRIESTTASQEGNEAAIARGKAVRDIYDNVLDPLYDLIAKLSSREKKSLDQATDRFEQQKAEQPEDEDDEDQQYDEDDDAETSAPKKKSRDQILQEQLDAIKVGYQVQIKLMMRTISAAWVALMRAMRRIQGKGKLGDPLGGSRQIFADARKRGRLSSDIYIAAALMEYHCYKDPAGVKIFDRGLKLFPEDELFALAYLKHLVATNDITNARSVFSTTVSRLTSKPETVALARPLYAFFHDFESQYGELAQVRQLEKKMAELYPEDPKLRLFSNRFTLNGFDATAFRPIVSPNTQTRPKTTVLQSTETGQTDNNSLRSPPRPNLNFGQDVKPSPKRPFDDVDSDIDTTSLQNPRYNNNNYNQQPPLKRHQRGESPLKGAAGRRLAQRNNNAPAQGYQNQSVSQPSPLPREINFLLSIIPGAEKYPRELPRFVPEVVAAILGNTDLSRADLGLGGQQAPQQQQHGGYPQYPPQQQQQQQYGGYPPYGGGYR